MPENNPDNTETPKTTSPDNGVPEIEDAYDPTREAETVVEEDDPRQPDPDPRTIEDVDSEATADVESTVDATNETPSAKAVADDSSDTANVADVCEPDAKPIVPDWSNENSARRIIVELKRVESEVRTILEGRDWKRKRKLGGTRRWLELEEDILSWRHSGRFDETTIDRLHDLIGKRHYLFKRLRFIAATRPTWNT